MSAKHWTAELCIQAVQRYEDTCRASSQRPSVPGYEQWRQTEQQEPERTEPSYLTIIRILGSWNRARALAAREGEEIKINPRGGIVRWNLSKCLAAITRYERHCQETRQRVSRDGYQEWHTQTPDTPSVGSIEHIGAEHFGAEHSGVWNSMRLLAAEQAGIDAAQIRLNRAKGGQSRRGR